MRTSARRRAAPPRLLPLALVLLVLVGVPATASIPALQNALPARPLAPLPTPTAATQAAPHVVIAVVDTGINPYHEFFRAPALADHPSTWLPGYPAGATSVHLTLGAADLATALAADAAAWNGLQRSAYNGGRGFAAHLYHFPGTRVVGAITFGEYGDAFTPPGATPVLDEHGHGTRSAGLALGANLSAPEGNVLVVAIEVAQGQAHHGIRWAAREPWIDAISVSMGALANAPQPASLIGDRRGMESALGEAARAGKPVLMASGNGVSGTALAPDHCSTYTSAFTGPVAATRIGAADPASGNPTWWHCLPVDAVARTDVAAPRGDALAGAKESTGTSAATPNAAAHLARLLLDARQAGVAVAPADALRHLLNASEPAPLQPGVGRDPGLAATAPLDQGHGLVDEAAADRALARILAGAPPAPRPELEAWAALDAAIRHALWDYRQSYVPSPV